MYVFIFISISTVPLTGSLETSPSSAKLHHRLRHSTSSTRLQPLQSGMRRAPGAPLWVPPMLLHIFRKQGVILRGNGLTTTGLSFSGNWQVLQCLIPHEKQHHRVAGAGRRYSSSSKLAMTENLEKALVLRCVLSPLATRRQDLRLCLWSQLFFLRKNNVWGAMAEWYKTRALKSR